MKRKINPELTINGLYKYLVIEILSKTEYENMLTCFLICKKWYEWIKYSDYFYRCMLKSKVSERLIKYNIKKNYCLEDTLGGKLTTWKEIFSLKNNTTIYAGTEFGKNVFFEGEFMEPGRTGKMYDKDLGELTFSGTIIKKLKQGYCYVKTKNYIYNGYYIDNKFKGYGELELRSNFIYKGEFDNDLFHGKGFIKFTDGTSYEGDFYKGKKHGIGKYIRSDGNTIEGEFKNDLVEGRAKLTNIKFNFEGEFKNNRMFYGKIIYKGGFIYEGPLINNIREGIGKYTFPSGNFFEGEFKADKMYYGKYTYLNGTIYIGQMNGVNKEGQGKITYPNGESFEGEFKENSYHKGIYKYNDGNIYEGYFKNNLKNGAGIFKYKYFSVDGLWSENKSYTETKLIHSFGRTYEIEFQKSNGEFLYFKNKSNSNLDSIVYKNLLYTIHDEKTATINTGKEIILIVIKEGKIPYKNELYEPEEFLKFFDTKN